MLFPPSLQSGEQMYCMLSHPAARRTIQEMNLRWPKHPNPADQLTRWPQCDTRQPTTGRYIHVRFILSPSASSLFPLRISTLTQLSHLNRGWVHCAEAQGWLSLPDRSQDLIKMQLHGAFFRYTITHHAHTSMWRHSDLKCFHLLTVRPEFPPADVFWGQCSL